VIPAAGRDIDESECEEAPAVGFLRAEFDDSVEGLVTAPPAR